MPRRTGKSTLWQAVEEQLQTPVPPEVRRFCRARGWVNYYLAAEDPEDPEDPGDPGDRASVVELVASEVQNLWDSGVVPRESDSLTSSLAPDSRWPLLQKLNAAYHEAEPNAPGSSDWQPLRVSRVALNLDTHPATSEVVVRFDSRLSRRALNNALRSAWPQLHRRGWLRRSRPLSERALALLRFVCLDTPPDSTWHQRLEAWNVSYPNWAYSGVRAFERDFRRVEEELTGERYGLEWFYNSLARLDLPELYRARAGGAKGARQLIGRRVALMRRNEAALRRALARRRGGARKKRSSDRARLRRSR